VQGSGINTKDIEQIMVRTLVKILHLKHGRSALVARHEVSSFDQASAVIFQGPGLSQATCQGRPDLHLFQWCSVAAAAEKLRREHCDTRQWSCQRSLVFAEGGALLVLQVRRAMHVVQLIPSKGITPGFARVAINNSPYELI
jgi:hypothetical protein